MKDKLRMLRALNVEREGVCSLQSEFKRVLERVLLERLYEEVGQVRVELHCKRELVEDLLRKYDVKDRDGMVWVVVECKRGMDADFAFLDLRGYNSRWLTAYLVVERILADVGFDVEACEKKIEEVVGEVVGLVRMCEGLYREGKRQLEASEVYKRYLELKMVDVMEGGK